MTIGMGLDRAYFEFQKLVFFGTPYYEIHICIQGSTLLNVAFASLSASQSFYF